MHKQMKERDGERKSENKQTTKQNILQDKTRQPTRLFLHWTVVVFQGLPLRGKSVENMDTIVKKTPEQLVFPMANFPAGGIPPTPTNHHPPIPIIELRK